MDPALAVTLLWFAFGATHIVLSSLKLRPRLVAALGEPGFMGVYSLVALATFVPMVTIYFRNKHSGPLLWSVEVTAPVEIFVTIVMGISFIIMVAGNVTPSPTFMKPGRKPGDEVEPVEATGIHFITRHAVFMSAGLFGLIHLIANGYATDVAFFAGFPIFAVIGSMHQDSRKLITDHYYPAFYAETALIPFTGKHTLRGIRELTASAWIGGIALTFVIRYFHSNMFGGAG
jgi:uncharacterized membrane protein